MILIQYVESFTIFENLTMASTLILAVYVAMNFYTSVSFSRKTKWQICYSDQLSIVLRLGIELSSHNFQNTAMSSGLVQTKRLKHHGLWCRIYLYAHTPKGGGKSCSESTPQKVFKKCDFVFERKCWRISGNGEKKSTDWQIYVPQFTPLLQNPF